ncbi:hypothetical protein RO3G_05077 [Rhizopus delemar RA 99-880]|uniref:Cytochrome P450 n=1 Tax=Rhizopus delemar (strain RA 99-880 / ATCC MYA-4621 / FGSC 9543 / NRRL 43880) TaxID=246409 RepID=I1BVZ2_RHIO9|nr:hypothetical protein RO3G_05077 [Rhizopus delemar RA 99-880]|eukprot:EIE80372.1 hypothetical protein RO3G_05077 [Rhizopus delemar RA 99-880]
MMEIAEFALESYRSTLEKILPVLQKKSKKSYIGAAITLIVLHRIYSYFKVPKRFQHLPKLSYFPSAKSIFNNEPIYDRYKRLVFPVIKENNGIYVSKISFDWTVYIANPVAAKHVLLKADLYPKSHDFLKMLGSNSPVVQFLGYDSVGLTNGHVWKNQRKLMNPAFHRSMPINTMSTVIPDLFFVIEKENGTIAVPSVMRDFTLDVLGLTVFGFDFKALKGDPDEWTKTFTLANEGLFDPILNIFGPFSFILTAIFPKRREQLKAVAKLNGKLEQLIHQKRMEIENGAYSNTPENEKDLVALMLEAEKRGEGLTNDLELRHNIAGFFLAGHDTTANALSFCFYNLAKNKHVQNKLRQEIISVLGDDPKDVVPTLDQLKEMPYLNLVLKENLRLNGPADNILPRVAAKDMVVDGTFIPKGATVNIDIYGIHHNPKFWNNPDDFIPERLDENGEQDSHDGLTWLPFGNGARQCLGMNFSLTEQRLLLVMMIRKYEIDVPKDSIHYERVIFGSETTPPNSLELTFKKRY